MATLQLKTVLGSGDTIEIQKDALQFYILIGGGMERRILVTAEELQKISSILSIAYRLDSIENRLA